MTEQGLSPHAPVPVAFLMCDQVMVDEATKTKTLVRVFDQIWGPATCYSKGWGSQGRPATESAMMGLGWPLGALFSQAKLARLLGTSERMVAYYGNRRREANATS